MTETLRSTLREQADRAALVPLDPDAISRAGARSVRRRRWTAAAGSAAAVVVVGSLAALALGGGSGDDLRVDPAAPAGQPAGVSWATGSVIHTPDATIETGHLVAAYVRMAAGYVTVDPDGVVRSVVEGRVSEVGRAAPARLVADVDGGRAAWVDGGEAVVLDVATGRETRSPAPGTPLTALDGADAYADRVLAAEDGVLVRSGDDLGNDLEVTRPGSAPLAIQQVSGSTAVLSPDAAYVSLDADEPAVFDTATGEPVALDLDAWFATGYEWLDDDTLVLLTLPTERSAFRVVTCTVPAGACTTVVPALGAPYDGEADPDFTLPVGYSFADE